MSSIMTNDPLMTGVLGVKKNCYRKMSVICSGARDETSIVLQSRGRRKTWRYYCSPVEPWNEKYIRDVPLPMGRPIFSRRFLRVRVSRKQEYLI